MIKIVCLHNLGVNIISLMFIRDISVRIGCSPIQSLVLYSIIETAKANGLMPFDYINHCRTQLAIDPNEVESLLPWNVNLNV